MIRGHEYKLKPAVWNTSFDKTLISLLLYQQGIFYYSVHNVFKVALASLSHPCTLALKAFRYDDISWH